MLIQKYRQKIIDPDRGDCFSTCIACILKCRRDYVPNFLDLAVTNNKSPNYYFEKWLRQKGYRAIEVQQVTPHPRWCTDIPFIATVPSQKFDKGLHAVVGMLTSTMSKKWRTNIVEFSILHDPNPTNELYPIGTWPTLSTFIVKV